MTNRAPTKPDPTQRGSHKRESDEPREDEALHERTEVVRVRRSPDKTTPATPLSLIEELRKQAERSPK